MFLTAITALSLSSDQLSPSLAYILYMFHAAGGYFSSINFKASLIPLDI